MMSLPFDTEYKEYRDLCRINNEWAYGPYDKIEWQKHLSILRKKI